ncbi:hypothetical protein N234_36215 [Ralstonia pickettii DTP0602]|nr:hypothetical protein N234_36215 [Ralstonia pickettii DTP0602]
MHQAMPAASPNARRAASTLGEHHASQVSRSAA